MKINENVDVLRASKEALALTVATNAKALEQGLDRLEALYSNLKDYVCSEYTEKSMAVLGEKATGVNIEALQLLQDQMKALASSNLKSNNGIVQLSSQIQDVENKISAILLQTVTETLSQTISIPRVATISNNNNILSVSAADVRWINDARNQLQQFDASMAIHSVRQKIAEVMKPLADELANKIDTQIQEAKKNIIEKKSQIAEKITSVDKKVDANTTDLNTVNEGLKKQIETNALQNQLNVKVNDDIIKLKVSVNTINNDMSSLKQLVNESLSEFQTWYNSLTDQIKQIAMKVGKEVIMMSKTAQQINADNRKISMGTYDPDRTKKFINKHIPPST